MLEALLAMASDPYGTRLPGGLIILALAWGLWNSKNWARLAVTALYALTLLAAGIIDFAIIVASIYFLWFDGQTARAFRD